MQNNQRCQNPVCVEGLLVPMYGAHGPGMQCKMSCTPILVGTDQSQRKAQHNPMHIYANLAFRGIDGHLRARRIVALHSHPKHVNTEKGKPRHCA